MMRSLRSGRYIVSRCVAAALLAGCSAATFSPIQGAPPNVRVAARGAYGLGPIVQPKLAGTILGFDIDQHGDDGVFANYQQPTPSDETYSIETFDGRHRQDHRRGETGKERKLRRRRHSGGRHRLPDPQPRVPAHESGDRREDLPARGRRP